MESLRTAPEAHWLRLPAPSPRETTWWPPFGSTPTALRVESCFAPPHSPWNSLRESHTRTRSSASASFPGNDSETPAQTGAGLRAMPSPFPCLRRGGFLPVSRGLSQLAGRGRKAPGVTPGDSRLRGHSIVEDLPGRCFFWSAKNFGALPKILARLQKPEAVGLPTEAEATAAKPPETAACSGETERAGTVGFPAWRSRGGPGLHAQRVRVRRLEARQGALGDQLFESKCLPKSGALPRGWVSWPWVALQAPTLGTSWPPVVMRPWWQFLSTRPQPRPRS